MKTLVSQSETKCHEERKGRHRPWFIFLVFCCSSNVLVRWFRLHNCESGVRPFSRALPKMGAIIFVSLYIVVADVQLSSLPRHVPQETDFQTRVAPLLPPEVSIVGTYPFRGLRICAENLEPRFFFIHFLITAVIHPWLADLQRVLWPDSLCGQLVVRRLLFLIFSLFHLPPKLASCSLSSFDPL